MIILRYINQLIELFGVKLKHRRINYFYDKRSYYYKILLSQYVKVDKYISMYKDTDALTSLHTDINIMPNLLGRNMRFVRMVHGKPWLLFTENNITVFIYKRKLNNIKVRYEIHLYMGQVFFVSHNYQSLVGQEKDFVVKSILKKYLDSTSIYNLMDKKIMDTDHNMICISDIMGLKINYLGTKESEWYNKMSSDIEDEIEATNALNQLKEQQFIAHI
jgi:hypothetical protein